MTSIPDSQHPPNEFASMWDDPEAAKALESRDIARLFRFLRDHGVSQRRIAACTGQAQSEISEIVRGRLVTSYLVLERIAVGLGIPRGRMGLAYDEHTCPAPSPTARDIEAGAR